MSDPRKAASQHLTLTRTSAGNGARQSNIVSQKYSVRYLGNCLNAYIKGDTLRYSKVFDDSKPLNIYGVPSDPTLWW